MSSTSEHERCPYADEVSLFALHALPAAESAVIGTHIASCIACQKDLASLQPVIEAFAVWPVDVLRPSDALWDQLTKRITVAADGTTRGAHTPSWTEPDWEDVAPGICCKLLSNDVQRDRVCMLVRLAPATEYPPHCGSMKESSTLETTTAQRRVAQTDASGARLDVRVCSSHRPRIC
jgi:hypothetical protein